MQVGDLVKSVHGRTGVIVDIDPLRIECRSTLAADHQVSIGEIVIMLPCGTMWHANPKGWEVLNRNSALKRQ